MKFLLAAIICLVGNTTSDNIFLYPSSAVIELTHRDLTELRDNLNGDVILLIYSELCPHCKVFAMQYEGIAKSYAAFDRVKFVAINIAIPDNFEVVSELGLKRVPAVFLLQPGLDPVAIPYQTLKSALLSKYPDFTPILIPTELSVWDRSATGLSTKPAEYIADAILALRILLNSEVHFESATIVSDVALLLRACIESFESAWVVGECVQLRRGILSESMTPETWTQLLQETRHFKPYTTVPAFQTCRGFGCAFWRLLHVFTLGDRTHDTATMIRAIVDKFMSCEECRTHFLEHFDAKDFGREEHMSKKETVLWLMRFHNAVSTRVQGRTVAWPPYVQNDDQAYDVIVAMYTLPKHETKSFQPSIFVSILAVALIIS